MARVTSGQRILVIGGGYVGMYSALRLQHLLRHTDATITVVDRHSYMTYQPFLPEAAAGSLEPRHVVVPLRRVLHRCRVVTGELQHLEHARRTATIKPAEGQPYDIGYDHVVLAPGSISRTMPIPGLAEVGIGFKTLAEAVYLRNYVLSRLDAASSSDDERLRRRALTFVFVGGGYAGIEAFAELEDMARAACRDYHTVTPTDMHWVLVEAADRILPEVGEGLARYTVERLRQRGMDLRLGTRLDSCEGGHVRLSDGTEFDAETVVWTAGVRAHPVLERTDLPRDDKGRLRATAMLQVDGVDDAWTAGDCAAVPDLTKSEGALCGPSAQHAVRQAKVLADNLVHTMRGRPLREYRHAYAGSVASLGLHKGVSEVYGIKLRGWPAWFMHRTYHLSRVPTFNRKVRVVLDWTLALFFPREIVSLGQFADPRAQFEDAARGGRGSGDDGLRPDDATVTLGTTARVAQRSTQRS
jgi:NADH:ubiquinone reductase (H+-translocating)